jgi:CheY-like chemotaxis protein
LAEDHAVNQKVALRILERLGYRADVAANGLEVLAALERRPYDVVLMDVQMPEMDGLEASRRIRRSLPDAVRPHVIAMTANAMRGDRERCFDAGMEGYVPKPVSVDDLAEALWRCSPVLATSENGSGNGAAPAAANGHRVPADDADGAGMPTSNAHTPDGPALDRSVMRGFAEELGEGADDIVRELIGVYLEDAPGLLHELRQALDVSDARVLDRAAHTLKSSSATLGAKGLAAICLELEQSARHGDTSRASEQVGRIEAELQRVSDELRAPWEP